MKEWWIALKIEVGARLFSSRKRLIKWIGISLVPIIYGVICIVAFWNPTQNLGKVPTAVLDQDKTVYLLKATDQNPTGMKMGVVIDDAGTTITPDIDPNFIATLVDGQIINTNTGTYTYNVNDFTIETSSTWALLRNVFINKDEAIDDENFTFKTSEIGTKQLAFSNIKYVKGSEAINQYQNNKYWLQIMIPDGYFESLIKTVGTILNQGDVTTLETMKPLNIWTTYERNFIFGYYMETMVEFEEALPIQIVEQLVDQWYQTTFGFDGLANNGIISNESMFGTFDDQGVNLTSGNIMNNLAQLDQTVNNEHLNYVINSLDSPLKWIWPIITLNADFINQNSQVINRILYDYFNGISWWDDSTTVNIHGLLGTQTSAKLKDLYGINRLMNLLPKQLTREGIIPVDIWTTSNGEQLTSMNQIQWNDQLTYVGQKNGFMNPIDFFKWVLNDKLPNELINFDIQGASNGIYGIGLGEFFLLIGLFVGTLMQTFVLDRGKRYWKATHKQWFFSKVATNLMVGMIQTTVLAIVLYAVGWHVLGIQTMALLWLFMLVIDCVFVVTVLGFWYLVKDETVGKFLAVVYMVLNLAAGWGTFPSWMQFKFFDVISHILEFRYALHGLGTIIYGFGSIGYNYDDMIHILVQVGALLAFGLFFLAMAYFGSINRHKEMLYGAFLGKYVYEGLIKLNQIELAHKFIKDKPNNVNKKQLFKYNWKALENKPNLALVKQMKLDHPFEAQYKWYQNKDHDQLLKPNFTDEDDISRKDEVEV